MDTRPRPTIKRVMNTQFDCTLRFIGGDQYSLRAIGRGVTPMSCFETPSRKLSLRENWGGSGSTVGRAMVSTRVPSLLFVISRNLANISLVISGRTKFPPRTRDIHPRPTNERRERRRERTRSPPPPNTQCQCRRFVRRTARDSRRISEDCIGKEGKGREGWRLLGRTL